MQDGTTTPDSGAPAFSAPPRVAPRRSSGELLDSATRAGTARYAARHAPAFAPDFYRVGPLRLRLASLGAGTSPGEHDDASDAAYVDAVARALHGGVNLVDTAINYRCQRSERAIGHALQGAMADGVVARDEVVLCSKGGYVPLDTDPPTDRAAYERYLDETYFAPGIMTPDELVGGGHCLSPRFLADSVRRSCTNLGVATVDAYCIHNPEQQLAAGVPREELLARLREAFTQMEACADAGEIGVYGVASWSGFRVPQDHREHLSLAELVRLAREVAGDAHRFRLIQLPVSLAMPEAFRAPTQPPSRRDRKRRLTALAAAAELEMCVMAHTPLMQGRLVSGLPPAIAETFPALRTDAQRALAFVRGLPQVTAVLVGMRQEAHLRENLDSARAD